jgi:hypothetical protein
MFDFPPIAWHHDFSRNPLPETKFSPNISFVRPHVKTAWTEFSIVEAELRSMEQLYSLADPPDRFVLLSGSDYPIKPARQILSDLQAGDFDAHISFDLVREGQQQTKESLVFYKRHLCYNFPPPPLFRWLKRRWPIFTLRYRGPFRRLLPFSRELECYQGSQWWVGNRKVKEYLCDYHRTKPALANYYRRKMFPDESYPHTVVVNAPQLKVNNNNWRYLDWSQRTSHPKTLGLEDLPKLIASPAPFARKFNVKTNPEIFDRLDEITR